MTHMSTGYFVVTLYDTCVHTGHVVPTGSIIVVLHICDILKSNMGPYVKCADQVLAKIDTNLIPLSVLAQL